jgi:hypothetical protein
MTNDIAKPLPLRVRPYLFLIIAFGVCLRMVYFSQEIGGSHTFRQAMVANQIDSLKSTPYPGPKLGFLERYDQVYDYGIVFYDTPIYQYIAAKLSDLLSLNGVRAARLINLAAYIGISLLFYEILLQIGLSAPVSLLTMLLFAISPLGIQNLIGIYPDTLATLAAYASFFLLMRYEQRRSFPTFLGALALGYLCTLIKSSIYVVFLVAYAWQLLWSERLRVFRRFDAMAFAVLIVVSIGLFVVLRTYFNYAHVIDATDANYDESLRLSWFLGTDAQRFDLSQWGEVGSRFTFEYLFPAFMPFAVIGLWRVFRGFLRKPDEPQRTLVGLVVGALAMILVFFNVFFRHDYYALPLIPIYCALTSIGLFYAHSSFAAPFSGRPRAFAAFVVLAVCGLLYYAYSLRLLSYEGNQSSIRAGMDLQELVPADATLFYFQGVDDINPEYLYYTRRRGVVYDFANARNDFVANIIKTHHWDPDNTYLMALGYRVRPDYLERLKQQLDRYNLTLIGTTYYNGIVYKIGPKS